MSNATVSANGLFRTVTHNSGRVTHQQKIRGRWKILKYLYGGKRDGTGKLVPLDGVEEEEEPDEPDLIPITLGDWRGNFLYDRRWYFGPSLLAGGWDAAMRQEYYQWNLSRGYTHLWVNAQQDNWDQRYTRGGFDVFRNTGSMDILILIAVLKEIRAAQLIPCVGIHDQPEAARLPWEILISQTQRLINATFEHVALYMVMGWELNENDRWATGGVRNPAIIELFQRIDPQGRDLGVHYAPPALKNTDEAGEEDLVFGGFQLWEQLPPHAVRLQQIPKEATNFQLIERTEAAALVHRGTNTKICAFEHSRMTIPGREVDPDRSLGDAESRAAICLDVLSSGLPASRRGSMNG